MKNKKRLLGVLLVATIAPATAGVANATTEYVGGGKWVHGFDTFTQETFSNYYHPSRSHGSSACNRHECHRSPNTRAGAWARSSIKATAWGNTVHWR